jgi:KDO2-lipid IV(A) lauroyltransferase
MTRLLGWLAGYVPRRPRLWIGGALAELVYLLWASKRRVTIGNMAQVASLPASHPHTRWLARRSWRNYGRYVADFFYLPNATVASLVARFCDTTLPPGWKARVDRGRAGGRGLLVPTAHIGNWDVAGIVIGTHVRPHVIAETFPDPRLNALVQRQRAALGMTVVPMERTPRRILRILQDGGVVATPVDRPLPPGEGVPVTFFGRRCFVPGGIAQLALKTGAAIVPGFVWYDEAYSPTYYIYAAEPIIPQSTGDRRADTIALTQRIFDEIARVVRDHPTQWYMFRPFWSDEPDATAAPDAAPSELEADGSSAADEAAVPDVADAQAIPAPDLRGRQ